MKAHERINLEEEGDRTRSGVWCKSTGMEAEGHQIAKAIEDELDRRNANYKPRGEVKQSTRERL